MYHIPIIRYTIRLADDWYMIFIVYYPICCVVCPTGCYCDRLSMTVWPSNWRTFALKETHDEYHIPIFRYTIRLADNWYIIFIVSKHNAKIGHIDGVVPWYNSINMTVITKKSFLSFFLNDQTHRYHLLDDSSIWRYVCVWSLYEKKPLNDRLIRAVSSSSLSIVRWLDFSQTCFSFACSNRVKYELSSKIKLCRITLQWILILFMSKCQNYE